MDEREKYDDQRARIRDYCLDVARRLVNEGSDVVWPAAVVGGLVAAAGQFAHESGMDQQELWRLIMEDLCRDQGLDPSVLDQGSPDGQT